MDGFINLLKGPGLTSHDYVQALRRLLGEKRIGHGGTLDPEAAGVLPVMVGQATRLSEFLLEAPKVYRAEVILGITTDTGDGSGQITRAEPQVTVNITQVEEALAAFRGRLAQRVPRHSAVHFQGRRLYELARAGVDVETPVREVTIYSLTLLEMWPEQPYPRLLLEVACSAGTYIRTLGADMGTYLGCGAYLRALVRTAAGPFRLEDSLTLEEVSALVAAGDSSFYLPPDAGLQHLPTVHLPERAANRWRNGQKVMLEECTFGAAALPAGRAVRVYDSRGRLAGIGITDERCRIKPDKVFR